MANLKIEFDRKANAAYIYLVETIAQEASARQVVCCGDEKHVAGEVILDFNKNGKLLGIDIMNATALLSPELLRQATRIG